MHELLVIDHLTLAISLRNLHLLVGIAVSILINFLNGAKLVLTKLEVNVLGLLNSRIDSVNFKLVGMHLSLIILQLSTHLLQLLSALLEVGLIEC